MKIEEIWDKSIGFKAFDSYPEKEKIRITGVIKEYAKQQAIAFARWISDYEMEGSAERLYDQFIFLEQQNKDNDKMGV